MVRLYVECGWSAAKVSARFGTTFSPIYRVLKRCGVIRHKTGESNRVVTAKTETSTLEAVGAGAGQTGSAESVGVSHYG